MTARDRTVLLVVAALAILAGFWFAALGPKRDEATQVADQVDAAQQRLDTARQTAASATAARERYASDYAAVARLGKAVPAQDDVPTLLYQLERAAHDNKIDFRSITAEQADESDAPPPSNAANAASSAGGGSSDAAAASSATAATLPPGAAVGPAGFPVMPFSFNFDGGFFSMQRFLRDIDRFTEVEDGRISVRGRLLTVDGIALKAGRKGFPRVNVSVAATAYLLPAEQGLTGGSTAQAPADSATAPASSGTSSNTTTPATATSVSNR